MGFITLPVFQETGKTGGSPPPGAERPPTAQSVHNRPRTPFAGWATRQPQPATPVLDENPGRLNRP
jgi:hypothetical protein